MPYQDDPVIPFRVSHANQIASMASQIRIILSLMGAVVAIGTAMMGWLLMHP